MRDEIFPDSAHRGIYIAEIGLNHNGDSAMAEDMIRAAAGAGADAVKFQTIVPEELNSVYTTSLLREGRAVERDETQIDFFRQFSFTVEEYTRLQRVAAENNVVFLSSVFSEGSLAILEELNIPLYKLASSEVTNLDLIAMVAETGKPLILSTGMAGESDIAQAVTTFKERSSAPLTLMHCVSLYPPEPEAVNLRRISTLMKRFGLSVGFSDHSRGSRAMAGSAVLGSRIFEKHFTIDRTYECPDKEVSLTPEEFRDLIEAVEETIAMMGEGTLSYGRDEGQVARAARRSLFARRPIPEGKIIEREDLIALRPGVGISPQRIDEIVGRYTVADIEADAPIEEELLLQGD